MEVLASMNRMSAITFLSLYFLRKDGLDCSGNTTGPAFEATQEFLITYCLTFVCFIYVIQIEAPDFDPDIDEAFPIPVDQSTDYDETQGSINSTQQLSEKTAMTRTPASSH